MTKQLQLFGLQQFLFPQVKMFNNFSHLNSKKTNFYCSNKNAQTTAIQILIFKVMLEFLFKLNL